MIAKKRGKKEIYWANLINNYWKRFKKKAEKLKNNKNLINNNKSKGINKKQLKKKKKKKKINEEEFNPLLERIKKIEGKIKLMMKILLYRTEPC